MALPTTRPTEQDTPTPTPKTVPDEGHANAADKPFYERPGHAGAAVTPAAAGRKVKED